MNILTYKLLSKLPDDGECGLIPILPLPCIIVLSWVPNKCWPVHCQKRTTAVFVQVWSGIHSVTNTRGVKVQPGLLGPT